MSLVNVQQLQFMPIPSQKGQIVISHSNDKDYRVPSLSSSITDLLETTIFFNNGLTDSKKQWNSSPSKYQRAILFAKKTLSQLQHKKKMRQNQLKISRIKQKCSKLLTNSKSTNGSSEYNSKHDQNVVVKHNSKNHEQAVSTSPDSKRGSQKQTKLESNGKVGNNQIYFKTSRGYDVFRILKFINGGAFGKVYLAQNVDNFAIFSIKIIPRSVMTKDIEYQLFRQIKIQMFLDHPNIIKLYHFYVDNQNVYLVLEPCLGDDLYKNLKSSSENLTEKQMSKIVKQVCQAVEFMHKHDIIHRDIKPQNVLIHENVVKVCDFGWAIFSPLLRITQCGTPLYSSPQMLKKEHYDSKIDVWCIGVLAYEIFYGTIPFQIRRVQDLDKIVMEDLYFPKNILISREAKQFIMACMDKNPYHRYNIQQALQHSFLHGCERYRCTIS